MSSFFRREHSRAGDRRDGCHDERLPGENAESQAERGVPPDHAHRFLCNCQPNRAFKVTRHCSRIGCEAVLGHARPDPFRHARAGRFHALRGRVDLQRTVDRILQILRDGFGGRLQARRRHGVCNPLNDVVSDARRIERGQEVDDLLDVIQVLLRDRFAVLNLGHDFRHIRGDFGNPLRGEVVLHALIECALVG